jgi:hypothetical protein
MPRGNSRGETDGPIIGAYIVPPTQIKPHKAIADAVTSKAGRYGRPKLPYIVAVNAMEGHAREIDAFDALLGTPVIEFVQMADGRREERATRKWRRGPSYRGCTGD